MTGVYDVPFGAKLGPHVLARFSGALRRSPHESLDVLGIALRFSDAPIGGVEPRANDQDLLFATILSPFTMALAPLTTRSHDFFANRYYAVSPFALADGHHVKFRLSPLPTTSDSGTRAEALAHAVARDNARFVLEVRETWHRAWHPLLVVKLESEVAFDQVALRFDPFRDGGGITPVGLVHAMRRRAYPASQSAR